MKINTLKPHTVLLLLLLSLTTSCIKLDFSEENTPIDPDKVTLITNWDNRQQGVERPASYMVEIDNQKMTYTNQTNALPDFAANTYTALVYNEPKNILINKGKANINMLASESDRRNIGWLFTSHLDIEFDGKGKTYTTHMIQQVRQLNFEITVINSPGNNSSGVALQLDGVASELELATGVIRNPISIKFDKITTKEGNTFKDKAFLLGIIEPAKQKLEVKVDNGSPFILDLSSQLSGFNTDKHLPMTVKINLDLTTGKATFTISISDWIIE